MALQRMAVSPWRAAPEKMRQHLAFLVFVLCVAAGSADTHADTQAGAATQHLRADRRLACDPCPFGEYIVTPCAGGNDTTPVCSRTFVLYSHGFSCFCLILFVTCVVALLPFGVACCSHSLQPGVSKRPAAYHTLRSGRRSCVRPRCPR